MVQREKWFTLGLLFSVALTAAAYIVETVHFAHLPRRHPLIISILGSVLMNWMPWALYRDGQDKFAFFMLAFALFTGVGLLYALY